MARLSALASERGEDIAALAFELWDMTDLASRQNKGMCWLAVLASVQGVGVEEVGVAVLASRHGE